MTETRRFAVKLTRTIAAPRERVYRAFLDPDLLRRWMSPEGFPVVDAMVDERIGGVHRIEMLDAAGRRHAFDSVVLDLVPGERIVLGFRFEGPEPGMRTDETLVTVTLRDAGAGATELTFEHARLTLVPPFDPGSVDTGWGQALDKLEALYERS